MAGKDLRMFAGSCEIPQITEDEDRLEALPFSGLAVIEEANADTHKSTTSNNITPQDKCDWR